VRLSGRFVAFKGGSSEEEINSAKHAIQTLGGKLASVHSFSLPMDGGNRSLVEIEKVQPTSDKYPRNNGRIKAKPL
jgi:16S rRNA (guanine527-N7)-methyltransferase